MISYDDLVVALAAWRGRQGLPVVHVAGSAPVALPAARAAPPAPPKASARPAADDDEFDDGALIEDSPYDSTADDYITLGEQTVEPAASGSAPEPVTEGLLVPKRGKRTDW